LELGEQAGKLRVKTSRSGSASFVFTHSLLRSTWSSSGSRGWSESFKGAKTADPVVERAEPAVASVDRPEIVLFDVHAGQIVIDADQRASFDRQGRRVRKIPGV
jgi:hypothetical protein